MKRIISMLLLLSFLLTLSGCGRGTAALQDLDSKKEIVVGMELAYPPFETTDEKGNPAGISVDLAGELGKYLGKSVKIENMAFSGLIPSLETGKIDLIISSMTITDDRKKTIDFSDPYCKAYLCLLINKNSPVNNINGLNVKGRKVAVKKGTTGHIYAEQNLKNCEVMAFDKESACVLEVTQGKADAFIYDQMTIYKNWKQYPDSTKVNLEPFGNDYEYWGIGLNKNQDELKGRINQFLKEFKENGGFDRLSGKYLKEQKKTFQDMGIPFFF